MSMITALNNMIDSISQNVPKAENEYMGGKIKLKTFRGGI